MGVPASTDVIASFSDPPVVEVVAAVRFSGMSDASFFALGDFWEQEMREDFPSIEVQAPYEPPTELFDKSSRRPGIEFGFKAVPPLPRLWLTAATGTELIQLQKNWFAANWRKAPQAFSAESGAPTAYDRWRSRRGAFEANWTRVRSWLESRGDDSTPDQCEVTYINHIYPMSGVWSSHGDMGNLFKGLSLDPPHGFWPEQVTGQAQFRLPNDGTLPEGRVHLSVQPAFTGGEPTATPIVVMEITARSAPIGSSSQQVLETLDRARAGIVQLFVHVTSDLAKKGWGHQ